MRCQAWSRSTAAHGEDGSAGYLHRLSLEERSGKQPWHQEARSAEARAGAQVIAHGTAEGSRHSHCPAGGGQVQFQFWGASPCRPSGRLGE